jgi:hypothetical protein
MDNYNERKSKILGTKRKRNKENVLTSPSTCSETDIAQNKRIRLSAKSKKAKSSKNKEPLDSNFNINEKYFYQSLSESEFKLLNEDITAYLIGEDVNLNETFSNPKFKKGNSEIIIK